MFLEVAVQVGVWEETPGWNMRDQGAGVGSLGPAPIEIGDGAELTADFLYDEVHPKQHAFKQAFAKPKAGRWTVGPPAARSSPPPSLPSGLRGRVALGWEGW
ncbi:Twinfilin-2 [Myotis davidii]|uniref:Twinfilin-2 n=1 Tax=Myotis davidii TaxID=225400 RepID=L5LGF3_MYODS|nr:Twinfilin-2 [Myotis davidii]